MLGGTHALIGFAAGMYLARMSHSSPLELLGFGGLCALSALLPDIDHPHSSIRSTTGFVGDLAFGWMKHRGVTHSITALGVVGLLMALIMPSHIGGLVVTVGYGTHLLADFLTPAGIPLLAPISWKRVRIGIVRTGGFLEAVIAGVLTVVMLNDLSWSITGMDFLAFVRMLTL